MRIAGYIEHPSYKITVFTYNAKYIIKIEAGPMEQIFKLTEDEISGLGAIKEVLDEEFMLNVKQHFDQMFASWGKALTRHGL